MMMPQRMLKPFVACVVLGVIGLYSAMSNTSGETGSDVENLFDRSQRTKSSDVNSDITRQRLVDPDAPDETSDAEFFRNSLESVGGGAGTSETRRTQIDLDARDTDVEELFRRLVVVTAFSEDHRMEAMGMIGTVQRKMPRTRIIAYDLGIDTDKLPDETLNEFGAIFWADASVRFKKSLRSLLPFAKEHHGYLSRIHSYFPSTKGDIPHNFKFTHEKMYDFFEINRTEHAQSSNSPHVAANRQLIFNSTTIQKKVIRPLYACALNESCISPPGAKRGNHQFDASALMLVFYKYLPGEFNRGNDHLEDIDKVLRMHRYWDDWHRAKYC